MRLVLADNKAIDEAMLKRLGARGILRASAQGLQVVLGPIADQVAGEIRAVLRSPAPAIDTPGAINAPGLIAALGGPENVLDLGTFAGRLLIRTARPDRVDESAFGKLGVRGIADSAADSIQLLVAGNIEEWSTPLRRLL